MSDGFWNRARRSPDECVLIEPDGSTWSAGALLGRANALVRTLRDEGLGEGDAVVSVAGNSVAFITTYLAALQAGMYFVPLNENLTGAELEYVLQNSGARAVVTSSDHADRVASAADAASLSASGRFCAGGAPGFRDLDDVLAEHDSAWLDERTAGAFMPYTSGTTGRPKGIRRRLTGQSPDEQWGGFAAWQLRSLGVMIDRPGVHLVTSPLYHTAVISLAGCSLHVGHSVVLMRKFDPELTLELIERHRVTTTHMVPTQFHRLLRLPPERRERADTSSLQAVVHGAAPCPPEVKRQMIEWLGPVVYEYYGASEAGGTVVTSEEWLARPGTVGRPYESAEIRILGDDDEPVPAGIIGRVFIRMGDHDFEYHDDPEKTASARSGRFVTAGDLGYLDDDGFLFLCGRSADLVISGGVNVYPAEIEGVLLAHPAVEDAAVIGVPDDEWGESVLAVVSLAAGWSGDDATSRALIEHCAESLAKYKRPREIRFVETLPRDPNGKMNKSRVRTLVQG